MAKSNPKSFSKKKFGKNAAGPAFRTPDHFKAKTFGGQIRTFNPGQFKIQHKA